MADDRKKGSGKPLDAGKEEGKPEGSQEQTPQENEEQTPQENENTNELDCVVCRFPYNNRDEKPLHLPCSHSVCLSCIEKVIKKTVSCPVCHTKTADVQSTQDLKVNDRSLPAETNESATCSVNRKSVMKQRPQRLRGDQETSEPEAMVSPSTFSVFNPVCASSSSLTKSKSNPSIGVSSSTPLFSSCTSLLLMIMATVVLLSILLKLSNHTPHLVGPALPRKTALHTSLLDTATTLQATTKQVNTATSSITVSCPATVVSPLSTEKITIQTSSSVFGIGKKNVLATAIQSTMSRTSTPSTTINTLTKSKKNKKLSTSTRAKKTKNRSTAMKTTQNLAAKIKPSVASTNPSVTTSLIRMNNPDMTATVVIPPLATMSISPTTAAPTRAQDCNNVITRTQTGMKSRNGLSSKPCVVTQSKLTKTSPKKTRRKKSKKTVTKPSDKQTEDLNSSKTTKHPTTYEVPIMTGAAINLRTDEMTGPSSVTRTMTSNAVTRSPSSNAASNTKATTTKPSTTAAKSTTADLSPQMTVTAHPRADSVPSRERADVGFCVLASPVPHQPATLLPGTPQFQDTNCPWPSNPVPHVNRVPYIFPSDIQHNHDANAPRALYLTPPPVGKIPYTTPPYIPGIPGIEPSHTAATQPETSHMYQLPWNPRNDRCFHDGAEIRFHCTLCYLWVCVECGRGRHVPIKMTPYIASLLNERNLRFHSAWMAYKSSLLQMSLLAERSSLTEKSYYLSAKAALSGVTLTDCNEHSQTSAPSLLEVYFDTIFNRYESGMCTETLSIRGTPTPTLMNEEELTRDVTPEPVYTTSQAGTIGTHSTSLSTC